MTVLAVLRNGDRRQVAARLGGTVEGVEAALRLGSLTGSAVPLASQVVLLEDGEVVPYAQVARLEEA